MRIAIIGAGACGLMLANKLNNDDVTIFYKGKIGSKILASGNGRCNIGNTNIDKKYYHNNPLAEKLIKNYYDSLMEEYKKLHIYTDTDDEGRMYPLSYSSQSVLNALLKSIKVKFVEEEVRKITKKNGLYYINNNGGFDKVVIASGSNAGKRFFDETSFIRDLNVEVTKLYPSLVGFKTLDKIKEISGVRAKVEAILYEGDKLIASEKGEVVFKDDGISGICIMNLSSYYARLENKKNATVKLVLASEKYDDYSCILQPKLYEYLKKNKMPMNEMTFKISGVYEFEFAQVTSGGIKLSEISDDLSLKKDKNIYVGGEVIDCDGLCGGYNLMFAFMCALQIGDAIHEISD